MSLQQGNRAQIKLQGNQKDGREGRPDFPGGWGSWGIKNQGILILSNQRIWFPPPPQAIIRFSILAQQGFSLTPEYVQIENIGGRGIDLAGYYIVSHAAGTFPCPLPFPPQDYTFAPGSYLGPGQFTRVYSGAGSGPAFQNPPISYQWVTQNIWLNPGDMANLYNSGDILIDSLAYGTCAPP